VLCALPILVASGIFAGAHKIYGEIGPAFYGLRTTLLTLLLMALWRMGPGRRSRRLGTARSGRVAFGRHRARRFEDPAGRSDGQAQLLQVGIGELGQHVQIDLVRLEHRRILAEAQRLEPLTHALHRRTLLF